MNKLNKVKVNRKVIVQELMVIKEDCFNDLQIKIN